MKKSFEEVTCDLCGYVSTRPTPNIKDHCYDLVFMIRDSGDANHVETRLRDLCHECRVAIAKALDETLNEHLTRYEKT